MPFKCHNYSAATDGLSWKEFRKIMRSFFGPKEIGCSEFETFIKELFKCFNLSFENGRHYLKM